MNKKISFFFTIAIIISCVTAVFLIIYNYNLISSINEEESSSQLSILPEDETTIISNLPNDLLVVDKIITWGYYVPSQTRIIDTVIIHSSYDALGTDPYSVDGVIYEYKLYNVSAHYLIDRNGTIFKLVEDKNIAYHAGSGKMPDDRININNFSIGIELLYHENEMPNEIQYQRLVRLIKNLKLKYKINYILGHKDIAPSRKTDPWNFNWQKFNEMLKN